MNTSKVTRVEVIDEKGLSYVNWKSTNNVEVQMQDGGRTLKIFIGEKKENVKKERVHQITLDEAIESANSVKEFLSLMK